MGITHRLSSSVPKYYAVPFAPGGITLKLDVTYGYITCYISDTSWKTDSQDNEWVININSGEYADRFIDPAEYGRSGTHYIFVTIYGHGGYTYMLNSTSGNFSSQGNNIITCLLDYS